MPQNRPFSLLVKPASADCNLRCAYCFYLDRSSLYPETGRRRMSDRVLERMIATYMAISQPQYSFGWQGGEPTLMGVEFFRRVTELQEKYGRRGAVVANGLQTNATLIDDELAAHLGKYNFLVGVSLDGPEEAHNRYRRTIDDGGTHAQVLRGMECLRRHRVEFNVLTLVNAANVKRGREVFNYLCDLGVFYHQYIPCVEFDESGRPQPYAVTGEEWGDFLCGIFDEWLGRDPFKVSVRLFDSILLLLVDGIYNLCHLSGTCCQYFVVEYNGDVYPCDFFVETQRKLGNIMDPETSWVGLQNCEEYLAFGRQKADWHQRCQECEYLIFCSGDCLKHRLDGGGNPQKLSWLCAGWQRFYSHALPEFKKLAQKILRRRETQSGPGPNRGSGLRLPELLKTGRNDSCFCGSGKKYKKCHGTVNVRGGFYLSR